MSKETEHGSRSQLVNQLVDDLPASKPPYKVYALLFGWICVAWIFSIAMTLLQAPLRSNWAHQLASSPQFLLEVSLGFSVATLLAFLTFQKAVPGLSRRVVFIVAVLTTALWITGLFVELYFPALSSSMEGKRAHCIIEIIVYSIPLMIVGFAVLRKGFVLNWPAVGFGIGLASGFIPAVLMQLACMYDPAHALQCHVLPAVFLGGVGTVVGVVFQKLKY